MLLPPFLFSSSTTCFISEFFLSFSSLSLPLLYLFLQFFNALDIVGTRGLCFLIRKLNFVFMESGERGESNDEKKRKREARSEKKEEKRERREEERIQTNLEIRGLFEFSLQVDDHGLLRGKQHIVLREECLVVHVPLYLLLQLFLSFLVLSNERPHLQEKK